MPTPTKMEIVYFEDTEQISHIILTFEDAEIIIDVLTNKFYEFYLN